MKLKYSDFYFENGLLVFTESYLKKRGKCCHSGCRHCPYKVDFDRTWYILKTANDLIFDLRYGEDIICMGSKIPVQWLENKALPIEVEIFDDTYLISSVERILK